ncbi:hypothetical protein J4Q44_G00259320 [Coregonus suidteri]|uniref:Uncharacterized protein n=1 Tax=Coregonus suidteri TaxID=861788 RepID=A0AAN8L3P2_9TELE
MFGIWHPPVPASSQIIGRSSCSTEAWFSPRYQFLISCAQFTQVFRSGQQCLSGEWVGPSIVDNRIKEIALELCLA